MLERGLYAQVIFAGLERQLHEMEAQLFAIKEPIDEAVSSKILADHMHKVIRKALSYVRSSSPEHIQTKIDVCNRMIDLLQQLVGDRVVADGKISPSALILLEIIDRQNSGVGIIKQDPARRPVTPLAESSLFTGSQKEPSLVSEIKKEIKSANAVDIIVSFIRWSGLRLIWEELLELTENCPLRVITTSYMGATELKAVQELSRLPNTEVRVSYDIERTRLHAKAYLFQRSTGFSAAYIGSSNLSRAAMSSGLEWNIKLSEYDSPDILRQFRATFETYWNSPDFEVLDLAKMRTALRMAQAPRGKEQSQQEYVFSIRPYPYQQEILEKLWVERNLHGRNRNLVVAATGTGKTVIAAFDYASLVREVHGKRPRLLFVAHREEILKQSLDCFRQILRDPNFGDLCVGAHIPEQTEHLFISVQIIHANTFLLRISSDYYNYIVIDEFHHAAAPTYQQIIAYFQPGQLLGLTATPERMDNQDVTEFFGGFITAELRLFEAINRKLLSPFHYFGIADGTDLSKLSWTRRGYDINQLENVYTTDKHRVHLILQAIGKYGQDILEIRGLGFCVSVAHAKFMADEFVRRGIPALSLHGKSPANIRQDAKLQLQRRELNFIFAVDLFNEGIDIPEIDTVLLLRPTESVTVFLQQIGRGLRLCDDKECLTVFDFIGQCRREFRFEDRFLALLGKQRQPLEKEIHAGFPNVPKGCYLQLEKVAQEVILKNIQESVFTQTRLIQFIRKFDCEHNPPRLRDFLALHHLSVADIYRRGLWSRLCVRAGRRADFQELDEALIVAGIRRLLWLGAPKILLFFKRILSDNVWKPEDLTEIERNMLRIFYYTFWQIAPASAGFEGLSQAILQLRRNQVCIAETIDLINFLVDNISLRHSPVCLNFPCALELHAQYSRDQILAELGYYSEEKKPAQREGVLYFPAKNVDILFVTLDKSEKEYSPSTMYEDYVISESLFHWQSQSTTAAESTIGRRYIKQRENGNSILLFVREKKKLLGATAPYVFLGPVHYVKHEGSRPISIVWKLEHPLPPVYLDAWNEIGA